MAQVIHSIPELQKWSMDAKKQGKTVGLIPTMGFLHEGHLSLIDTAHAQGADAVAVSIFVNPTQFGPNEDFDRYPRDFEHDRILCEQHGADVIFAPEVNDMYPAALTCWVQEEEISKEEEISEKTENSRMKEKVHKMNVLNKMTKTRNCRYYGIGSMEC